MRHTYKTSGTCSTAISFELDGGAVHNVKFERGCEGNLKAIPLLIEGLPAEEVVRKLKGVTCGGKSTSCADQLAAALTKAMQA